MRKTFKGGFTLGHIARTIAIVTAIIMAFAACERSVGYDGNNNVNGNSNANNNNTEENKDLTVEIDENTPEGRHIPRVAQRVHFVRFLVKAPEDQDVEIIGPTLTRRGLGDANDMPVVQVIFDEDQETPYLGISTSTNQVDFSETTFYLGAGESAYMDVYANMDAVENSENYFCLEFPEHMPAFGVTTGEPVNVIGLPEFPLCGYPMTTTSAVVGVLNYDAYVSENGLNDENTSTTEVIFEATVEDMDLYRFRMKQIGTFDATSIVHVMMTVNAGGGSGDLNVDWEIVGDYIVITLPEAFYIPRGMMYHFSVVVSMSGTTPCDTVGFIIESPMDIEAIGRTYGFGVSTVEFPDYGNPTTRYIPGHEVHFVPSANNPPDFDVLSGENDVTGLSISVLPQNSLKMWSFPVQLHKQYDPQDILDIKAWAYNSQNQEAVFSGPQDVVMGDCWNDSDPTVFTCIIELTDTVNLPICESTEFWFTFDTAAGAQSSTFNFSYLSPQTSFTYIDDTPFPVGNVFGGTINGPTIQIIP
ncbi:hypothetical protein ACFL3C_00640 [Patescibacteria group bacterium]